MVLRVAVCAILLSEKILPRLLEKDAGNAHFLYDRLPGIEDEETSVVHWPITGGCSVTVQLHGIQPSLILGLCRCLAFFKSCIVAGGVQIRRISFRQDDLCVLFFFLFLFLSSLILRFPLGLDLIDVIVRDLRRPIGRSIMAILPPCNFIVLHYTYFIITPLICSVVFWGASTPSHSVAYVDALFMCVSAITGAGLNSVCLPPPPTRFS